MRRHTLAVAALALLAGRVVAGPPVAGPPPSVVPLHVEPAGEVVDVTPPELPGRAHVADPPSVHAAHEDGGFTAAAEVLLWRPRFGDTGYALLDPLADLTPQGRVKDVQPGNRAGLRVGGRYRFEHYGWDVGVTYTHLKNTGSDEAVAPAGGLVYPLLTRAGGTDRAARAAAEVTLKYNLFDLDAGRTFALDDHLAVRPFAGVRFADLDTRLTATYDGRLARRAEATADSLFRGAGPTAGAAAEWRLGERVGLFGSARGGLVYGTFDTRTRETNGAGGLLLADVGDRFSGVVPTTTVALGGSFRWRSLEVAGGYELTHWFGAVARPDLPDDFAEGRAVRRRGDLSLDGVFVRLAYTY